MKIFVQFVIAFSFLVSCTAFAGNGVTTITGSDAVKLYLAMQTDPVAVQTDDDSLELLEKKISGLSCFSWKDYSKELSTGCKCAFTENITDSDKANIFENLDAEFSYASTSPDCARATKWIGSLSFCKDVCSFNGKEIVKGYEFPFLGKIED